MILLDFLLFRLVLIVLRLDEGLRLLGLRAKISPIALVEHCLEFHGILELIRDPS